MKIHYTLNEASGQDPYYTVLFNKDFVGILKLMPDNQFVLIADHIACPSWVLKDISNKLDSLNTKIPHQEDDSLTAAAN